MNARLAAHASAWLSVADVGRLCSAARELGATDEPWRALLLRHAPYLVRSVPRGDSRAALRHTLVRPRLLGGTQFKRTRCLPLLQRYYHSGASGPRPLYADEEWNRRYSGFREPPCTVRPPPPVPQLETSELWGPHAVA